MINIILTDSEIEEIYDFAKGLYDSTNKKFVIKSKKCNGRRTFISNIYRYFLYIFYPFLFFLNRKKYKYIIGWQQFYAIFYAFYCNIFKVKKVNNLTIGNFTYKEKKGLKGKLYFKFIKFSICNKYVDYIHVPSKSYANTISKFFDIPIEKMLIVPFGLPDTYENWKKSKVEYKDYSLAIGRSNRDFDFLVKVWNNFSEKRILLIISDQYNPSITLPKNVILRKDISGDKQFPYIINSNIMIIPIDDGSICSGDTVLLKAMSYYKTVIVSKPSTIAETYIVDRKNGICIDKDENKFVKRIDSILKDKRTMDKIGLNARKTFELYYSRYEMGKRFKRIV